MKLDNDQLMTQKIQKNRRKKKKKKQKYFKIKNLESQSD